MVGTDVSNRVGKNEVYVRYVRSVRCRSQEWIHSSFITHLERERGGASYFMDWELFGDVRFSV